MPNTDNVDEVVISVNTTTPIKADLMFFLTDYSPRTTLLSIVFKRPLMVTGSLNCMMSDMHSPIKIDGTDKLIGNNITNYRNIFGGCPNVVSHIDFHNLKPSTTASSIECVSYTPTNNGITSIYYYDILSNMTNIRMENIPNVANFSVDIIQQNVSFVKNSNLTKQSVLNLINAVDADGITFTLHSSVFAKCENEWAEEINAAIDNLYDTKGYDVYLT